MFKSDLLRWDCHRTTKSSRINQLFNPGGLKPYKYKMLHRINSDHKHMMPELTYSFDKEQNKLIRPCHPQIQIHPVLDVTVSSSSSSDLTNQPVCVEESN